MKSEHFMSEPDVTEQCFMEYKQCRYSSLEGEEELPLHIQLQTQILTLNKQYQ